mmetsp:Transcript_17216/g.21034  ORF Transcript_17216/g.21034 Transcript_17216/m.21034 type:complete len:153 (-) Transcript_17216:945-1403(-)
MDKWLYCSIFSCCMYSIWTISMKQASRTIDATASNLIQLPIRIIVTLFTALLRMKPGTELSFSSTINYIGDLNFQGVIYTIVACVASVVATFLFNDAFLYGGSGSAVTVITGCYPALSYVISMLMGLESFNPLKFLGVCLAVGSCFCFALTK